MGRLVTETAWTKRRRRPRPRTALFTNLFTRENTLVKPYLLSLGAGLLIGIVYSLIGVRSPAPPVIALLGLLGILAGEQIVPLIKRTHLSTASQPDRRS